MGKEGVKKSNPTGFGAKHRKAKVGKRAIKPANVTDTSFKTTSLHIQKQAIEVSSDSKEKLISFLSQTTHHAPAARCAAVRGIRHLISIEGDVLVSRYINVILPGISRNLVDESADVRDVVLPTLDELFRICVATSIPVKPFLPLHIAYITSGLNSLDSYVRRDGVRAVEILAVQFPSLVIDYVSTLLPAYSRVLADCRGRSSSTAKSAHAKSANKAKKQNKAKNRSESSRSSNPERCFALKSLVALLKTASSSDATSCYDAPKHVHADTACTSMIVCRSFTAHSIHLDDDAIDNSILPIRVILQLLLNLRDSWVEITQCGEALSSGLLLPSLYLEEASLLISSFQLLYHQYCVPMYTYYQTLSPPLEKAEVRQLKQFTSLLERLPCTLLDHFPLLFPDTAATPTNTSMLKIPMRYHSTNSLFCLLLSDMGSSSIPNTTSTHNWSTDILEYLLPRYQKPSSFPRMTYAQQQPIIQHDIQVMAQLLLKSKNHTNSDNNSYILNDKDRFILFQTFCDYFLFFQNMPKPNIFLDVIAIPAKVIPLLSKVLSDIGSFANNHILQLLQDDSHDFGKEIHKVLLQFPYLFKIICKDHLTELSILLDILLYILRQWNGVYGSNEDSISCLMNSLYNAVIEIFVDSSSLSSTEENYEMAENDDKIVTLIRNEPWDIPIIAGFPPDIKRKVIGILALLKSNA